MKLLRRRSLLTAFFVTALSAVIIMLLLFLPGKAAKQSRRMLKNKWLILTGKLVNAGGQYLWIECRGTGQPTVILDAGLTMRRETWGVIPEETAKFTRVCIYERAGLGDSESPPLTPRTSRMIVEDLHNLLRNAGENQPFLLVGHSFGGMNMRLYANTYPQEAAGLVLIDSSHEDEINRYAELMPPLERKDYLSDAAGGNYEHINLAASADELRTGKSLPPIPITILSADGGFSPEEFPLKKVHDELQKDLSQKLPGSRLITIKNSGHFIQQDNPQAVIDAIYELYLQKQSK